MASTTTTPTSVAAKLLREGRTAELWQRYCGFLDLTPDEFVATQKRLLAEQLRMLAESELGRKVTRSGTTLTPETFRQVAPLTTYEDYAPYLSEQREDALPSKPVCWTRTSGTTSGPNGKWYPISEGSYDLLARLFTTLTLLSGAQYKGDITLQENATILYASAPPPYITGITMRAMESEFPVRFIPRIGEAEQISFAERLQRGFKESMGTGLDYFLGIASVLVRIGDAFTQGTRQMSLSPAMLRPDIIFNLLRAYATSKMNGRGILPKDIWRPRGIATSGMDVQIYRPRIREMWGRDPLEVYGCTEFGSIAMQGWGARKQDGLTCMPEAAFWEFMPESEYPLWRNDRTYRPKTYLLNEVTQGRYVLVGTSLNGGALVRYVLGDLVRFVAPRNEELGIQLPQMVMESRVDGIINLASMAILTERSLSGMIGTIGLTTVDWVVCKEVGAANKDVRLHFYVEGTEDPAVLRKQLHEGLLETHEDYRSLVEILDINPVAVTMLAPGTLLAYMEEKQAAGAELGQLKPPRMQPSPQVLQHLLTISARLGGSQ